MSSKDTVHFDRDLDISNAGRGVWLVKVPKYIHTRFEKISDTQEAAKLRISKQQGQKAQVTLSLSDAIMKLDSSEKIPREHKLDVSVVTRQTLGVFSHVIPVGNNEVVPESEKIYMEGRIVQKLETRPLADSAYMKMKIERIKKTCEPVKKVKALEKVVTSFKPVSDHKHNIDYNIRKKAEGKKVRDDKEQVQNMLFNAFEKHQYYNIKDLVKITRQPVAYLKEVLKEVCDYNMKNRVWELKKEYRHYKIDEKKEDEPIEGNGSDDISD
ncbi:general transcription factor IIF subunit 2 [Culicoides brevitarsis]|uniref:general transcription factor IIF subunit 2 n=1 Tax=Culicoides brevitarsis TaxID=469753 RepID=UPI00307BC14F